MEGSFAVANEILVPVRPDQITSVAFADSHGPVLVQGPCAAIISARPEHKIGITFTNDANGGSASADRNLYVNGVDLNGTHYGSASTLWTNSTVIFTVGH